MRKRIVYGTPINPSHLIEQLSGRSFCVSYWSRQRLGKQLDKIIDLVGQDEILLVDNGAFSAWMSGQKMDREYWHDFARWASDILKRCPQAVCVVPDVIDGDAIANDEMTNDFICSELELEGVDLPMHRMMVVWHMHEPIHRLTGLIEAGFEYVAIGSSGQYAKVGTLEWHDRIQAALKAVDTMCAESNGAYRRPWIHMMRAQSMAHLYDFDSSDSTNVAVNHNRHSHKAEEHVAWLADRVAFKILLTCDGLERDTIMSPAATDNLVKTYDAKLERLLLAA